MPHTVRPARSHSVLTRSGHGDVGDAIYPVMTILPTDPMAGLCGGRCLSEVYIPGSLAIFTFLSPPVYADDDDGPWYDVDKNENGEYEDEDQDTRDDELYEPHYPVQIARVLEREVS